MTGLKEYIAAIDLERLNEFLAAKAEPVYESQLLLEFCPELDLLNGPAIELYRRHFALFHQLYRLKERLATSGHYLHVHFMAIHLVEMPMPGRCRHYFADSHKFCQENCDNSSELLCGFHSERVEDTSLAELSERYFYLDEANFLSLKPEDAEAFINGAWNLLQNYGDLEECYKTLGMPVNSSLKLVKLHFRKLARENHPDLHPHLGEKFSRLNSAYRRLLSYLSVKKL